MSYSSTFDACCGEIWVAANTQTQQILWAEKFMTKRLTSNRKFWAETLERCQLLTFQIRLFDMMYKLKAIVSYSLFLRCSDEIILSRKIGEDFISHQMSSMP